MKPPFQSQARQDEFVWRILEGQTTGSFLDIGCGEPVHWSNSYALETVGWRGLLVDITPHPDIGTRLSPFHQCDAARSDWSKIATQYRLPSVVDYLSLDIDEETIYALRALTHAPVRFRVITIEHDAYRFGEFNREPQRIALAALGYTLVWPDVSNPWPFEDWWVDRSLLPPNSNYLVDRFLVSEAKTPDEIIAQFP